MAKPPDAFLSYTRFDDDYHGGAISAFRQQLSMAVRAVTAKHLEIFQDVGGIGLGENWRKRLNIALGEARFFIPILTPNYFESAACRDELKTFLEFEAESGRDDLILPIYWLRCPVLEDPSLRAGDPLAEIINDRQRSNWLKLRYKPYNDPEVREALETLAEQIEHARRRGISGRAEAQPRQAEKKEKSAAQRLHAQAERNRALLRAALPKETADLLTPAGTANIKPQAAPLAIARKEDNKLLEVGTVFHDIDASWCPEMVVIPPGEFRMGSTKAERHWAVQEGVKQDWVETEKPQHLVRIGYLLAVGRCPVTFDEYDYFCERTHRQPPDDNGWGRGRRPVINVSWNDAMAYAAWLAGETNQPYRLLSETEWEYACAGNSFWWVEGITRENANFGQRHRQTSEVGAYAANPFSLYDILGNVWEWSEDCWNENYEGAPADGTAWTSGDCGLRIIRGASWKSHRGMLRPAYRNRHKSSDSENNIGLRVCRALTL